MKNFKTILKTGSLRLVSPKKQPEPLSGMARTMMLFSLYSSGMDEKTARSMMKKHDEACQKGAF